MKPAIEFNRERLEEIRHELQMNALFDATLGYRIIDHWARELTNSR
jgi:hypothetical protein